MSDTYESAVRKAIKRMGQPAPAPQSDAVALAEEIQQRYKDWPNAVDVEKAILAAAIRTLAAELEQARAERDAANDAAQYWESQFDGNDKRRIEVERRWTAAEAEATRYREVLAEIAHGPVGYWNNPEHGVRVWEHMVQIATDALSVCKVDEGDETDD